MACLPLGGYGSTAFQFLHRPYLPLAQQIAVNDLGYRGLPEYMPAGTIQPVSSPGLPEAEVLEDGQPADNDPVCRVTTLPSSPPTHTFATQATGPCRVRLAVYFYPYWQAHDEAGQALTIGKDASGLMTIDVPPGDHSVHVEFVLKSRVRTATAVLSVLMVLLVVFVLSATGGSSVAPGMTLGRES